MKSSTNILTNLTALSQILTAFSKKAVCLGILLILGASLSSSTALAQCGSCYNNGKIQILTDNYYGATYAQAYYWEVCSGNASIVGSNKNQTVNISGTGVVTLKITRFINGVCQESCITATCSPSCPEESCLSFNYQGNPQVCEFAWIQFDEDCFGSCDASSVQLSLHVPVGNHHKYFPVGETQGSWNIPDGNWDGAYLVAQAVIMCGGQECIIEERVTMDCYVAPTGPTGPGDPYEYSPFWAKTDGKDIDDKGTHHDQVQELKAIKTGNTVTFDLGYDEPITNVQVYNMAGQAVGFSLDKSTNSLQLNQQGTGILKAIITTEKGTYYSSFFDFE